MWRLVNSLSVFFCCLFTASVGLAQPAVDGGVAPPLSVQTRAVPTTVKLGEVFSVEIVVTHDKGQRYELKTPGDLGAFEFVASERSRKDGEETSTTTFLVKLQAFELGQQTTPPLALEVTEAAGTSAFTVDGTPVDVQSALPADAQSTGENLYDLHPPLEVPVRTWRVLYGLLAGLALALGAWALIRAWRRPKPAPAEVVKPLEPLHVRTLQALDALAKENLPAQGRVKEFYFRLSDITRGYLGEKYHFDAKESTTPELLDALRSRSTPGLAFKELADFAHQSDFVRYAKADVPADDCKQALDLAYRLVQTTTAAIPPFPPPSQPVSGSSNAGQ